MRGAGRAALDTNILLYAQGAGDDARRQASLGFLSRTPAHELVIPVQVLGEFHRVLRDKFRWEAQTIREALTAWTDVYATLDTTRAALEGALDLCARHDLSTWDAIILSVAAEHRCDRLVTEDLQQGFEWRGVRVFSPFADPAEQAELAGPGGRRTTRRPR